MFLFLLKLEKWFKWNDRKRIYHTFPEMQEHFRKNPRYNPPASPRPASMGTSPAAEEKTNPIPHPLVPHHGDKESQAPFYILWPLFTKTKKTKPIPHPLPSAPRGKKITVERSELSEARACEPPAKRFFFSEMGFYYLLIIVAFIVYYS
jgi:hypothetical protein